MGADRFERDGGADVIACNICRHQIYAPRARPRGNRAILGIPGGRAFDAKVKRIVGPYAEEEV